MAIFTGTSGDDNLTALAGDDTYQLGAGNDTITYSAAVDGLGVLTWNYGFDTVISTDGGVTVPNYDRIVFNFSPDYIWGRKVGNDFELSIYAHAVTGDIDPGAVDQVGKITLKDAFTASVADRLSKIEASNGFFYEAIAAPVADPYGHTAIYKSFDPGIGSVLYEEWYSDINSQDTQHVTKFTDGSAIVQYFDTDSTFSWSHIDITYSNYDTVSQALVRSDQFNDNASTFVSTNGNDSIVGTSDNDFISGLAGNDTINGGAGNDTLLGGAGADTVIGGAGDDSMDGGLQTDALNFSDYNTLNYASTTSALTINTALGTASSSTDGNDTFVNFYRIRGGSGNDTIVGNSDLHFEQFEGGAGDDAIDGGAITDTLNGSNNNRLTYQNAGAAVTVDLLAGTASGGAGNDTLLNFNQVRGSNFNDTLLGSNTTVLTEQFEGGLGNDNIDGRGGFDIVRFNSSASGVTASLVTGTATGADIGTDTFVNVEGLFGSEFNDILTGGLAANGVTVSDGLQEVFRGGAGNDTIDGGQGYDRVNYDTSTSGVTVTLNDIADGSALDGLGGTDVLRNIEGVRGSDFNDSITGSAAGNKLEGLGGNDQLRGEAGNDTLLGGDGNDYMTGGSGDDALTGGNGIDTADYFFSDTSAGIVVDLVAGTATGGGGNDTLSSIENVNGSDFNDTISGDAANNFIEGQGGNDTLLGLGGADTLIGGAGNDIIDGGAVLDPIFGTDWNFTSYSSATAGVNINLSGITGNGSTGSGTASGDASVGVDTLINVNQIQGSNFNDTITGSTALIFEQFEGGAGNDILNGGAITDTLNGDNDNRVTYHNATGAGVTVDFLAGTAVGAVGSNIGSDTLANFNHVRGSNFDDTLLGSNRTDLTEQFEGRAGNDSIDGRGGFDIVRYGSATAGVTVNLVTGTATGAGVGTDTLLNIEGVRGSAFNDVLTGGNAANGVTIGDGLTEVFRGEAGNDTIDGGQGYDRVDYTSSTAGVTVVLNNTLDGSASDGLGGVDVLRNIEGVRGSAFNDTLTGSNSAAFESFEGREGNDILNGMGGIDRADYQNSRAGVTVNLTSGIASDGYGGTDTLSNIENVRGSRDFNDSITGSAADNRLEGLGGNDTINGGLGFDTAVFSGVKSGYTITRGVGSVTVSGADGVDVLTGIEKLTFGDTSVFLKPADNDFDGDGKSDMLWRNTSTGANTIWKSASNATQQAVTAQTDQNFKVQGAGDFDGDGKSDILWRNTATGASTIWKSGNSATVQAVTAIADQNWKIVGTGDFDADGKSDILWRNTATGANTIWKSASNATQQAVTAQADQNFKVQGTGDFDGDGKSDILWRNTSTGSNTIWKSGNSATVQAVTAIADQNWKIVGTGDFDADGKSDILWRNTATGANTIWKSGNNATAQATATLADLNWKVVGTGDYGGDGKSDILWRNASTGADMIWSSGNSATVQAVASVADLNWKITPIADAVPLRAAMDFDGDGKSDILWRNTATGADTLWKSGNSATVQAVAAVGDQNWKVTGTGDFDGDGKTDILWRNTATGADTIWKSGNSATVQAVASVADQNWKIVGTGDFDGDGKSDILWRNSSTGANQTWKSGNSATVQAVTAIADQNWKVMGTGDFDGDGKSDILWRNTATGADTIWKSGNSATVQAVTAIADQNWKVMGTGDFDGDGKSDILWRNTATGANTIWKSGNSATVQAVTAVADQNWKVTGSGDYDGDGKYDILWRNTATGANQIWKSGNSATVQAVTVQADLNLSILDGLETGDLLTGGAGNNTLFGTLGNDLLFGGAGNDLLTGGLGQDLFRFASASQGNDTITDFVVGTDTLQLVSAGFANLAAGALAAGNFVSGAAPVATQASAQFLYNTSSGQVSFDADGTGAGTAIDFVTLVGIPALTAGDFMVVA